MRRSDADNARPDDLDCLIPANLTATAVRWAHVAVANADFPCDPPFDDESCPGHSDQLKSQEIVIDRAPEAVITITPSNPITGDTVSLGGTGEGQPAGAPDPFQWLIRDPDLIETEPTGTPVSVNLNKSGEWQFRLRVNYQHEPETPGGDLDGDGLYEAQQWEIRTISSVSADFTISPANPLNTEPITLDGNASNWQAGASLLWEWEVTGATTYNGCPDNAICTIPADALNWGEHTITLTLTNTGNNDVSTMTKTVYVANGSVQLDFTISDTTPDIGQTCSSTSRACRPTSTARPGTSAALAARPTPRATPALQTPTPTACRPPTRTRTRGPRRCG